VMTEIFFPEQTIRNFSAEGNEFNLKDLKINQVNLN
jgi:levanase/fructan beta-fructosidase